MDKLTVVNKEFRLNRNYIPNHLVICDNNERNFHEYLDPRVKPMLEEEAFDHFKELHKEALKAGYDIIVDSGYRSFNYQGMLWKLMLCQRYKILKEGLPNLSDYEIMKMAEEVTNSFVALPGQSEHQTGLALDFAVRRNGVYCNKVENSPESRWMMNNAHKYGFILRYPMDKKDITGFNYEEWHYRYVGIPYAEELHDGGITLEEYHGLVLKK